MDLFLSVHLHKQYLLITLLINLLILFKWTLLERFLGSLLKSLVIKLLIDNIFVERLGLRLQPELNNVALERISPHCEVLVSCNLQVVIRPTTY